MAQNHEAESSSRTFWTASISVLGQSSQQISGFVVTVLAAAFLSAQDYGVYALSVVFVEFVVMLTYTGFFHFLVTSKADDDAVLPTIFWLMCVINTVGGFAMILVAAPAARFFDAPDLQPVLQLLGLMQPLAAAISWGAACLTRAGRMRTYFFNIIVSNVLALLAGTVLLVLWQSLYALVAYRVARLFIGAFLFLRSAPQRPTLRFDTIVFSQAWRYALGLYGARSLTFFSTFGADLILAYVFSTAESGLYRFANRIATASIDIIAQPLRSFSLKSFGHSARAAQSLTPKFTVFFLASLFLVGGFALTVVVMARPAIETWFQPEYILAVGVVHALALRAAAQVGQHMIEPVFSAARHTEIAFYHNLFLSSLVLTSVVLFAPFGMLQVAWAQAAVQLIFIPFSLWIIAKFSGIDLRPTLARLPSVVAILLGYAVIVWGAALFIDYLVLEPPAHLLLLILAAFIIGCAACLMAWQRGILNAEVFS